MPAELRWQIETETTTPASLVIAVMLTGCGPDEPQVLDGDGDRLDFLSAC